MGDFGLVACWALLSAGLPPPSPVLLMARRTISLGKEPPDFSGTSASSFAACAGSRAELLMEGMSDAFGVDTWDFDNLDMEGDALQRRLVQVRRVCGASAGALVIPEP